MDVELVCIIKCIYLKDILIEYKIKDFFKEGVIFYMVGIFNDSYVVSFYFYVYFNFLIEDFYD